MVVDSFTCSPHSSLLASHTLDSLCCYAAAADTAAVRHVFIAAEQQRVDGSEAPMTAAAAEHRAAEVKSK